MHGQSTEERTGEAVLGQCSRLKINQSPVRCITLDSAIHLFTVLYNHMLTVMSETKVKFYINRFKTTLNIASLASPVMYRG